MPDSNSNEDGNILTVKSFKEVFDNYVRGKNEKDSENIERTRIGVNRSKDQKICGQKPKKKGEKRKKEEERRKQENKSLTH